jgi:hypothetical protein
MGFSEPLILWIRESKVDVCHHLAVGCYSGIVACINSVINARRVSTGRRHARQRWTQVFKSQPPCLDIWHPRIDSGGKTQNKIRILDVCLPHNVCMNRIVKGLGHTTWQQEQSKVSTRGRHIRRVFYNGRIWPTKTASRSLLHKSKIKYI